MMPPGNEAHEAPSNGASATAYEKLQRGHTSQVRANAERQRQIYKTGFDLTIPSAAVVVELRPSVGPAVSGAAKPDQASAASAAQGDQARAGRASQVRVGNNIFF